MGCGKPLVRRGGPSGWFTNIFFLLVLFWYFTSGALLNLVGLLLFVWAMRDGVYPMMMKRSMWDTAVFLSRTLFRIWSSPDNESWPFGSLLGRHQS